MESTLEIFRAFFELLASLEQDMGLQGVKSGAISIVSVDLWIAGLLGCLVAVGLEGLGVKSQWGAGDSEKSIVFTPFSVCQHSHHVPCH